MKMRLQKLPPRFWCWSALCAAAVLVTAGQLALRMKPGGWIHPALLPLSAAELFRADAWKSYGGSWDTQSFEIDGRSEERGAKLIHRSGSWRDVEIDSDMQIAESDGEAGVLLRSSDEEDGVDAYHGYFAGLRAIDNTVELGRADYGWHSLARARLPARIEPGEWVHLRIAAVGCDFSVEATEPGGRATTLRVSDPNCLRAGHFGLRSTQTSARWKNLHVVPASVLPRHEQEWSGAMPPASVEGSLLFDPEAYASVLAAKARTRAVLPGAQPIAQFQYAPGLHPDVTLQGMIISAAPLIDLQDDSSAMIVTPRDPSVTLKRGDVVEAHGDVFSSRFRSELRNAQVRVLWSDTPIPPLAVSASELTNGNYRGRTITIEGTLLSARALSSGYELVLKDHDYVFRAIGSGVSPHPTADLQNGSRLRLLGTATSMARFTNNTYPFAIVVDRFDVLSAPPWWSLRHILLLLGLVCVLFFAVQLVLHKLQQWHIHSLLREREELAFEMHDTLAQNFTGIAYQLQAASLEKRGERYMRAHIASALELVHLSHREASRTIAALRPQYRDADSILLALRECAERLAESGNLEVAAMLTGHNTKLPLRVTDALFRIGQEAISNAIQHSGCNRIALTMALHRGEVDFAIEDDGCGFATGKPAEGLGLAGMKNRAARIHAAIEISSDAARGTTIRVHAEWHHAWGFSLRKIFLDPR
jgi:signal transduction histidine kinase